jgi:hypothetical protein
MTAGYVEFEFDLPNALLRNLVSVFDSLGAVPLIDSNVAAIPEVQGVYQLFLKGAEGSNLVYIGKTNAAAGLRVRLNRHATKIQNRLNLNPDDVLFKAVRVYVFTAVDLEAQLIAHYGGAQVSWNGSGFGSNDPGRERDTTTYQADHFDTQFPIDIDRALSFSIPAEASAVETLARLKSGLPYLMRIQTLRQGSRSPHRDLEATAVILDPQLPMTPESVIAQTVRQLPAGWHATMLPSHVIIYKDDTRRFPSGRRIAESTGNV